MLSWGCDNFANLKGVIGMNQKRLVVGIDAGLNATKIVGPKGEASFPSLTEVKPPTGKRFRGAFANQEHRFELGLNDEMYVLGEHAKFNQQLGPESFDSHDGTGSKNDEVAYVRALGAICLYLAEYEPEVLADDFDFDINVYLAYGSPISSATDDLEVEEIEDRFLNNDKPVVLTYNDKELTFHIKDILVLPEGAAAFFAEEFRDSRVYIVDAGSRTINYAALSNGTPIESATDTHTQGVEFYKKSYTTRAAEQLARKIFSLISQAGWPKGIDIHVCGGYSDQIAMAFNDKYEAKGYHMDLINPSLPMSPRKSKPLLPIYANAAGLYFIAKEAFVDAATKG